MIIVAERINATRKPIAKAVEEKDAAFIQEVAVKQAECGADYIDVNAGSDIKREAENLVWLVETVQQAVDLPCAIDSANPDALAAGLAEHKGTPMINSISGESERREKVLPLVKDTDCKLVVLGMDDNGMPETYEGRIEICRSLFDRLTAAGLEPGNLYFDPLVKPVSTSPEEVDAVIKTFSYIAQEFQGAHTMCGLSNISFGIPERRRVNCAFMAIAVYAGMDAAIIDPTEPGVVGVAKAAEALVGKDSFCMEYLTAVRAGLP